MYVSENLSPDVEFEVDVLERYMYLILQSSQETQTIQNLVDKMDGLRESLRVSKFWIEHVLDARGGVLGLLTWRRAYNLLHANLGAFMSREPDEIPSTEGMDKNKSFKIALLASNSSPISVSAKFETRALKAHTGIDARSSAEEVTLVMKMIVEKFERFIEEGSM
ncbi:hypothetical protein SUGI_0998660 [Cryptomeria japonica]|nr:hypothetical protein SUGI_0998660 [Cryptomeria japonica]